MTRLKSLTAIEKCPLRRVAPVITGHGNPSLDNCLCLRSPTTPKGGVAFVGAVPV